MTTTTTTTNDPASSPNNPSPELAAGLAAQAVQGSAEAIATATVAQEQSEQAVAQAEETAAVAAEKQQEQETWMQELQAQMVRQAEAQATISERMLTLEEAMREVLSLLTPQHSSEGNPASEGDTPTIADAENAPQNPVENLTSTEAVEQVAEQAAQKVRTWI